MSSTNIILTTVIATSLFGLFYAYFLAKDALKTPLKNERVKQVSTAINKGANAYLKRQFKTIAPLIVLITAVLLVTATNRYLGLGRALAFLAGSVFSAFVGYYGMNIATKANGRVTEAAAKKSFKKALSIAFKAGATTGMLTVGLGLLGGSVIFAIYREQATGVLLGFGFGGSLLAFFMRVGGGIYTKAADIGADLVGKLEAGIPEDDPRNAAVIADNVGDNVGDCAGMAADIFESYEVTLVAAMILGFAAFGEIGVLYPLLVRGIGIVTSALGIISVKAKKGESDGLKPITRGFMLAAAFSALGLAALSQWYTHDWRFFAVTAGGIVLAIALYLLTNYFTSYKYRPTKSIIKNTETGAATTILSGLVSGYESSVYSVLAIAAAIVFSIVVFDGSATLVAYGIALMGMGMLTTTGIIVSMDSFGPVADNAQGVAEMAGLKGERAMRILEDLDSVGNTTKAATKGFAIGSAVIAAISLFESYVHDTGLTEIAITKPQVFVGVLIGGAVPFLFSAMTIEAVSKAAFVIVKEVRRQFKEIKGLMEGRAEAEYDKVVDICTSRAIKELIGPGLLAVAIPAAVGIFLKAEALGGFLGGLIVSGQLLAVMMANAGGAWDNAKKGVEAGFLGGKGTDAHKAAVVGDTVGDPLKDTSGPALNPLIKVMNLVALLVAPLIVKIDGSNPLVIVAGVFCVGITVTVIFLSKREKIDIS